MSVPYDHGYDDHAAMTEHLIQRPVFVIRFHGTTDVDGWMASLQELVGDVAEITLEEGAL